jgi:hypothetical protein
MRIQSANADSTFHGLAVGFQQRMAHGVQLQVAYNYSKSIDTGSGVTSSGENFTQGQRGVWYWDMDMKKGLSQFDIRNALTTNFTWQLPGESLGGFTGAVIGGWQASGILTLNDGHPLSIFSSTTIQNNAIGQSGEQNRANLVAGGDNNPVLGGAYNYYDHLQFVPSFCTGVGAGSPYVGKSYSQIQDYVRTQTANRATIAPVCAPGDPEYQPGHFGNAGRNTLSSPGLVALDFSLQKNFRVKEGQQVQFRAEFFNLTNRVNLSDNVASSYGSTGAPTFDVWANPAGGQITDAAPPRTIQLGLKYTF